MPAHTVTPTHTEIVSQTEAHVIILWQAAYIPGPGPGSTTVGGSITVGGSASFGERNKPRYNYYVSVCVCVFNTYTEYLAAICSLTGISSLGRLGNMAYYNNKYCY